MTNQTFPNSGREQYLEKPLPASEESERIILGAILLDHNIINQCVGCLVPEDFYSPLNRRIYAGMISLFQQSKAIDPILIGEELKKEGSLESIGGITTITNLTFGLPHFSNVEEYIKIVTDKSKVRQVIRLSGRATSDLLAEEADYNDVLDRYENDIYKLRSKAGSESFSGVHELAGPAMERVVTMARSGNVVVLGVPSGFKDLDDMTAGYQAGDLIITAGRPSMGKLQSLDSVIYTPDGPNLMRDITIGSKVIGFDGKQKIVTGVFPQGIVPMYLIEFSDGTATECGLEHLWFVQSRADRRTGKQGEVLTTKQIAQNLTVGGDDRLNYCISYIEPVDFTYKSIEIDPYVLGALIADGCFQAKTIGYSKTDSQIIERVRLGLPYNNLISQTRKDHRINKGTHPESIHHKIKTLGLMGKRSYEKFIPIDYLYNSIPVRIALLQGLFDGDGHIQKTGWIEYSTSSVQLAQDVRCLVLSLGGRVTIQSRVGAYLKNGIRIKTRTNYRLRIKFNTKTIFPFWCDKKASQFAVSKHKKINKFIKSVSYIGAKEAQCIMVDCPQHLYATDDFILTHNTSLALQKAINATDYNPELVIGIFSLEMTKNKLIDRFICMDARINSKRYRVGHIMNGEWPLITAAVEKFQSRHIYIDDASRLSMIEIKARCRRLRAEKKRLDMIIIDHGGLVKGSGRKDRRLELGEISKDCKALAKDFDVPVNILFQLSRSPEKRTDHKPNSSDLRECVVESTRLIDADTGEWRPITSFKAGRSILALDGDLKIRPFTVKDVWCTGTKQTFNLRTITRREIQCTDNHPFLTPTGWQALSDLRPGDVIATAMQLPDHGVEKQTQIDLCRLMGYMTGDGSYLEHRGISFISADREVFADVQNIIEGNFADVTTRMKTQSDYYEGDFVSIYPNGHGKPYGNAFREWLREIGVLGTRDNTKRVPHYVFRCGKAAAAAFLSGYLASDGCIKINKKDKIDICFDTTSLSLARDVQALLLRIGVVAAISNGYKSKKATQNIYRISPSVFRPNLKRLVDHLHIPGIKGGKLERVRSILRSKKDEPFTTPGVFGLPLEVANYVKSLHRPYQNQYKRMRRDVCLTWAEKLQSPELYQWATSDLLWESIVSIEETGKQTVYDISVPGAANFIGNGIVAHNSGELEEDADIVELLYRPDYYKETIENKGVAYIIVSKNRDGPTGECKLTWRPEFTRFENFYGD